MKYKVFVFVALYLLLALAIHAQVNPPVKQITQSGITVFNNSEKEYQQLQKDLQQLEVQKNELISRLKAFDDQQKAVTLKMEKLERNYDGIAGSKPGALLEATKQMKETQMSFNLQYLQLQSQMQQENRSYTAVSNIMKTKHDTVKNSISNVR